MVNEPGLTLKSSSILKLFLLLFILFYEHKYIRTGKKMQIQNMPHITSTPFSFGSALLTGTVTKLCITLFITNTNCIFWICIAICKTISNPISFHLICSFGYSYFFTNLKKVISSVPVPFLVHTILAVPMATCTPICTKAEELTLTTHSKFTKSALIIHKSSQLNWLLYP